MARLEHLVAVVACLLPAVVTQAAGEHGLIGYGIPEYHPLCCWTCWDVLFAPYLNCTVFMNMDMKLRARDMSMMGETSDACRVSNQPYMQTLSYCIQDECNKRGVSHNDQALCFHRTLPDGFKNITFEESLPLIPPTEMLDEDAEWLNKTMLVNAPNYLVDYATMQGYSRIGYAHSRWSYVTDCFHYFSWVHADTPLLPRLFIWFFTVGVCLVVGLYRIMKRFMKNVSLVPRSVSNVVSKYILVPALFGRRHLEPLPYKLGYVPSRGLSLFIFLYVSINIVFSAADIHLVWPATWWSSPRIETSNNVADRTGVLSLANMALTVVFSGRNTLVIAITGWSQTTTLTIHRWAARVSAVQAIVHSIVYSVQFYWNGGSSGYYRDMAFPGYYWGAVGTVALAIVLPFAILPLRAKFYEVFLLLHIALVVVAFVGTWYHIYLVYGAQNYYGFQIWLFVAFAFWGFDRLVRFIRLAILNIRGRSDTEFQLLPGGNFVQVTVFPKTKWHVMPGQHIFLYMTQLGKVWENHPFTIANHGYMAPGTPTEATSETTSIAASPALKGDGGQACHDQDLEKAFVSETTTHVPQQNSEQSTQSEMSVSTNPTSSQDQRFYIRFICRMHAGMTVSLRKRVMAFESNNTTTFMPGKVLLEGPYGSHRQARRALESADTVLCVTGGIGITHNLGFLQRYADDTALPVQQRDPWMRYTERLVFAWTVREPELIEHVRASLLPSTTGISAGSGRQLEYKFWITGTNKEMKHVEQDGTTLETGYRMNVEDVLKDVMSPTKRVVVIVCGPGGLADAVRAAIVKNIGKCKSLDLIEEAFAW